jgi:hypothetical protein
MMLDEEQKARELE